MPSSDRFSSTPPGSYRGTTDETQSENPTPGRRPRQPAPPNQSAFSSSSPPYGWYPNPVAQQQTAFTPDPPPSGGTRIYPDPASSTGRQSLGSPMLRGGGPYIPSSPPSPQSARPQSARPQGSEDDGTPPPSPSADRLARSRLDPAVSTALSNTTHAQRSTLQERLNARFPNRDATQRSLMDFLAAKPRAHQAGALTQLAQASVAGRGRGQGGPSSRGGTGGGGR